MKDTLVEIKKNFQGNSNRVDETENQISDLEHKEGRKNKSEKKKKKEPPPK